MRKLSFLVLVLALLAPFFAFLCGIRYDANLENRPAAPFPQVESLAAVFNPETYDQLSTALRDRNPLRKPSIIIEARLRYDVLGGASSNQVLQGEDGWLFIRQSVNQSCGRDQQFALQIKNLEKLQNAVEAAGKQFVFTIAPNKYSIYPEKSSLFIDKIAACSVGLREALQKELEISQVNYFNSFSYLSELKKDSSELLYSPLDTHWTSYASLWFAHALMNFIGWEVAEPIVEIVGQDEKLSDLGRMAGLYLKEVIPQYRDRRPGEQTRQSKVIKHGGEGRDYILNIAQSTDAPLLEDEVLFVHDSFFYVTWDHFASHIKEALYVHWTALEPGRFADLLKEKDLVVLETVEREVYDRLDLHFSTPALAEAVERHLKAAVGEVGPD